MPIIRHFQVSILSQISHELRIPLTGILGALYLLNKTPLSKQQKDYVEILINSAQRLRKSEVHIFNLLKNYDKGEKEYGK